MSLWLISLSCSPLWCHYHCLSVFLLFFKLTYYFIAYWISCIYCSEVKPQVRNCVPPHENVMWMTKSLWSFIIYSPSSHILSFPFFFSLFLNSTLFFSSSQNTVPSYLHYFFLVSELLFCPIFSDLSLGFVHFLLLYYFYSFICSQMLMYTHGHKCYITWKPTDSV